MQTLFVESDGSHMSGILLPGQENEPKEGGGKIEIAGGFSRARDERAAERAAAQPAEDTAGESEAAAGSTPDTPAAPPPGAARQAGDFAYPPSGAQVQCPSCGTPFQVPVFTIIDLGINPELKNALLGGQVNMAICPNCGMGGPLSAPLMVHDPENEFLGVFVPQSGQMGDVQSQRIIGELTQTLMRQLPSDARRGYMLQPKQFFDWQRFLEVLWESEGVTPEMLRRQRDQTTLLQRLAGLANDPAALKLAVDRDAGLIDKDFFVMLDRIIMMSGGTEQAAPLLTLREQLLETTEAGAAVKVREARIREILSGVNENTTRADFLEIMLDAMADEEDGEEIVATLALAATPLMDYEFLLGLTERLEASTDEVEQARLEEIRELVLEIQEQQRQSRAADAQDVQAVLQEVLQAGDTRAKLQEMAPYIDENFLGILAAQIRQAQENNAGAAVRRLTTIYQQALEVAQSNLPPELRLVNDLLAAESPAAARTLLKENRAMLTKGFVDSLTTLEGEMRNGGRTDLADRLKSLRNEISLMI